MELGEFGLSHAYTCLILHLDNSTLKGRTTVMFLIKIVKAGKKLTHIPVESGCRYMIMASETTDIRMSVSSQGASGCKGTAVRGRKHRMSNECAVDGSWSFSLDLSCDTKIPNTLEGGGRVA